MSRTPPPPTVVRNADWLITWNGAEHVYMRNADLAFDATGITVNDGIGPTGDSRAVAWRARYQTRSMGTARPSRVDTIAASASAWARRPSARVAWTGPSPATARANTSSSAT